MDQVSLSEGHYQQHEGSLPGSALDSDDDDTSSDSEYDENNTEKADPLKEDLQKTIADFYKSETNLANLAVSVTSATDEEFQATALCQFMDILNDLDEALDKSLLACLDENAQLVTDEDDVVCSSQINTAASSSHPTRSLIHDDNNDVTVCNVTPQDGHKKVDRPLINLGRSKSYSNLSGTQRPLVVRAIETNAADNVRGSMRRLDPIVLPAISTQPMPEPLTLPVILFLEHNVNMRPTSAPIQLQVTAANLSGDVNTGPLIVGRRTLLMNRALSLPSPGESEVVDWTGRSTARSVTRSSTSSSSMESLSGVLPTNTTLPTAPEERSEENEELPYGVWPHNMCLMLACLSCTIGMFNISRFAMFTVNFGASFIVQFFILSIAFGIPLFTLYMCLGRVLEAGPVAMWKISPIFQGVGITLTLIQAVIGTYSVVGIAWVFFYFSDSFISAQDKYKWAYTLPRYYELDDKVYMNATYKIEETIPQYFFQEVLQVSLGPTGYYLGQLKFQGAFHLAIVWMLVFIGLSRGLRSYGKTLYVLMFIPILGTVILCTKLLTLIPYDTVTNIFSETQWNEFFINSNSWAAAAQETFLTWGLLGPCAMQLCSYKNGKNKPAKSIKKDAGCIIAFTFAILLLAAFLASTCVQTLKNHGYIYEPGTFENVASSKFLYPISSPLPPAFASTPVRYWGHYPGLVGVSVWRVNGQGPGLERGWQPLRLPTLLVPAALALQPTSQLSPVWAILFYLIVIMFGIAQQMAMWHCVVSGIIAINVDALKVWETSITFLSCVVGLMCGLMLCTDAGIRIVHGLDYIIVGSWWQCLIHSALICGVFVVRGRPYSGEVVVTALMDFSTRLSATGAAVLTFVWNVILPVVLCAICVIDFRVGQQRVLYNWRKTNGYWPIWFREWAVAVQQGMLLILPAAAFVQTWRYMSKGPPDILDRIQNLYRPRMSDASDPPISRDPPTTTSSTATRSERVRPPDPPPKYTPPPSYSTATGARLMNTLRSSFRTLRRITSPQQSQESISNDTSLIPITLSERIDSEALQSIESQPPNYTGMFTPSFHSTDETDNPRTSTSRNSLTLTRDYLRRSFVRKSESVKSIRSSLRRSFKFGNPLNTSHEYLVREAEPMSNTVALSAMLDVERSPQARSRASVI